MHGILSVLLAASMAASPAGSGTPTESTTKKKQAEKSDPNRVDCRIIEHSGSRFKRYRVCMTVAEWENTRQRERQAVERIQSSACVGGSSGC